MNINSYFSFYNLVAHSCQRHETEAKIEAFIHVVEDGEGFSPTQLDMWQKIRDTITYEDLFTIVESGPKTGYSLISILADAASFGRDAPDSQIPFIEMLTRFQDQLTFDDFVNATKDRSNCSLLYKILYANYYAAEIPVELFWQTLRPHITAEHIYAMADENEEFDGKTALWLFLFQATAYEQQEMTEDVLNLIINDMDLEPLLQKAYDYYHGVSPLWLISNYFISHPEKFIIVWENGLQHLPSHTFVSFICKPVEFYPHMSKVSLLEMVAETNGLPFELVIKRLTQEMESTSINPKNGAMILGAFWDIAEHGHEELFSTTFNKIKQTLSRRDFTDCMVRLVQKLRASNANRGEAFLKLWIEIRDYVEDTLFLKPIVGSRLIKNLIKEKSNTVLNAILTTIPGPIACTKNSPLIELRNRFFQGLKTIKAEMPPQEDTFQKLFTTANELRHHGYAHSYADLVRCLDNGPSRWKLQLLTAKRNISRELL